MFSEKLRKFRKQRKLTQSDLAELLGVSPSAIGMYEQGRRQPDSEALWKLSRLLCVTVDSLVGDEPARLDIENAVREFRAKLMDSKEPVYKGRPLTPAEIEQICSTLEQSLCTLGG